MNELLTEILAAREQRAIKQQTLLRQYEKPLVCFTMNIPGPKKLDRDVSVGFFVGNRMLADAIGPKALIHFEQHRAITGCEAYYVVDMPAEMLKRLTVEIEDSHPSARLFDMDVLDTDGRKAERQALGLPRRKCLLCDTDAVICASTRAHPLTELQDRTGFLLYLAARQLFAEYIGAQAYMALQREVNTTPKPGLVDRNNRGAHTDMDMRHFFVSANALRPFLTRCAETGYLTRDDAPQKTFSDIRSIGKEAEDAMLKATRGVNTHKGAIFSMGILCAAAGRLDPALWQPETLLRECAAMTEGVVDTDLGHITPENAHTPGERLYAQYGITGVRGQAEAGFPAVGRVGLPIFREGLAKGLSMNDAGCAALLHILTASDDTNLIHRSDRQTQLEVQAQIAQLLRVTPFPDHATIQNLDRDFIQRNLSPGGTADLLAMTYFLHSLT